MISAEELKKLLEVMTGPSGQVIVTAVGAGRGPDDHYAAGHLVLRVQGYQLTVGVPGVSIGMGLVLSAIGMSVEEYRELTSRLQTRSLLVIRDGDQWRGEATHNPM